MVHRKELEALAVGLIVIVFGAIRADASSARCLKGLSYRSPAIPYDIVKEGKRVVIEVYDAFGSELKALLKIRPSTACEMDSSSTYVVDLNQGARKLAEFRKGESLIIGDRVRCGYTPSTWLLKQAKTMARPCVLTDASEDDESGGKPSESSAGR
jgi:hypothetical protein